MRLEPCAGSALILLMMTTVTTGLSAQTVRGRLLDGRTRTPIATGRVLLLTESSQIVAQSLTDSLGAFELRAGSPGLFYVRGERIGYTTATDGILDILEGGEISIDFYLLPAPVEIPGVAVSVDGPDPLDRALQRRLRLGGFFERLRAGFGHFLTPDEIEARQPTRPRDLFRTFTGVEVVANVQFATSDIVTMKCANGPRVGLSPSKDRGFSVWVNGLRVFLGTAWDMKDDVAVADIAALEVYTRVAQIPTQYSGSGVCGAIVVWTY